jgi:hypothetical protein
MMLKNISNYFTRDYSSSCEVEENRGSQSRWVFQFLTVAPAPISNRTAYVSAMGAGKSAGDSALLREYPLSFFFKQAPIFRIGLD